MGAALLFISQGSTCYAGLAGTDMVVTWDLYKWAGADAATEWRKHHPDRVLDGDAEKDMSLIEEIHDRYARNPAEATRRCEAIFKRHTADILGVYSLGLKGMILDTMNDETGCHRAYERALALLLQVDPGALSEVRCPLGFVLATLTANLRGAGDSALNLWERIAAANPGSPQPRRVCQILRAYRQNDPAPLQLWCRAARSRKRLTRETFLEEAWRKYPTHPAAAFLMVSWAETYLEVSGVRDARPSYEKLLQAYPTARFACEIPGDPGGSIAPYAHYVLGLLELPQDADVGVHHLEQAWEWAGARRSSDVYSGAAGVALTWLARGIETKEWDMLYRSLCRDGRWNTRPFDPPYDGVRMASLKNRARASRLARLVQRREEVSLERLGWAPKTTRSAVGAGAPHASAHRDQAETLFTGRTVLEIKNGDFVHPAFSPDGRMLAYAEVIVEGGVENTRIWVMNLASRRKREILTKDQAAKFQTYASYVSRLEWKGNGTLEAWIPDGDVDVTVVEIDVAGGAVHSLPAPKDGDELTLSEELKYALKRISVLYPGADARVFENAFQNRAFCQGKQAVIFQKNHAGHDHNVWRYDLDQRRAQALVEVGQEGLWGFGGGLSVGSGYLFGLRESGKACLYVGVGGKAEQVASLEKSASGEIVSAEIVPKGSRADGAWFLLRGFQPHEKGGNGAFWFDGKSLRRYRDFEKLHDFHVSPGVGLIAFVHWQDGKRQISVKKLRSL